MSHMLRMLQILDSNPNQKARTRMDVLQLTKFGPNLDPIVRAR